MAQLKESRRLIVQLQPNQQVAQIPQILLENGFLKRAR